MDGACAPTRTPRSPARCASTWTTLGPLVARPTRPATSCALAEAVGTPVDQVYIGNCANGTITDLRQAAEVFRGRAVHAATARDRSSPRPRRSTAQALREGLLDAFVEAGAMVSTPTCGACFGGGMGVLAAGETAVTTTNRNFRGGWARRRRACIWPTRGSPPRPRWPGELVDPAELIEAPAS